MSNMKDSGAEWLGKIPQNWKLNKIRYITSLRSEKGYYSQNDKYIGLENVTSFTSKYIETASEYLDGFYDVYKEGDLLFSKLRPYLAKALIAEDSGFCTGEFSVIKRYRGDIRFLLYFLLSHGFLNIVNSSTYGTKMPRASWDYIKQLAIPFLDIKEQQAIADFLDSQCSKIDSIVADIENEIDILEKYKKSLITETVTKGLDKNASMKDSGVEWIGEIPSHWKISKIKYEFENLDSYRKPINSLDRGLISGEYDYYGASGVIDKINKYIFDEPLLLIGEDGANLVMRTLPLIYKAVGKYWVNNHAHILRPKRCNFLEYWFYQLECLDLSCYISGSAQPKLTLENLNAIYITVPPTEEQVDIAGFLDLQCSKIDSIIDTKNKQLEVIKKHKQSLIYEYVTGKKRVKGFEGE